MSRSKPKYRGHWFQDRNRQWWQVVLNAEIVKAILESTGISLSALANQPEELCPSFLDTPIKLVAVLAFGCGNQIAERGLSPQQFLDVFSDHEPTLTAAGIALLGAIAELYPTSIIGLGAPSVIREWKQTKRPSE